MSLQRQVIRPGDMRNLPRKNDILLIEYTGWIYDATNRVNGFKGKQFDSSANRGKPLEYPLGIGATIKGWESALPQMSLGERTIWFMPAELAYGKTGLPTVIPPDADLVFEIELIAINDRRA